MRLNVMNGKALKGPFVASEGIADKLNFRPIGGEEQCFRFDGVITHGRLGRY